MKNLSDEEKLELIRDKMRGGPRKRITEFAESIGSNFDEVMFHAREYVRTGDTWNEGPRFDGMYEPPEGFWDWYELVTGEVVPSDKRGGFFSCSC